jgi:hypothetical protein
MNIDDFVLTKTIDETGKEIIVGGGYKVDSFLLQNGFVPMQTYNTDTQTGGKVSSPFENLAVPAGLFYINQKIPKQHDKEKNYDTPHFMLPDDIHDKLFALIQFNGNKKRKTKKVNINNKNKKTRKN